MRHLRMRGDGAGPDTLLARFLPGEEVVGCLKDLARSERLPSASITGLGAVGEATLAFFDRDRRTYVETRLAEDLEVVSMVGNIAWLGDDPVVHLHGVLSRPDATTAAGHIMRAVVSVTVEATLIVHPDRVARAPDSLFGLNLLDLPGGPRGPADQE